jgi:hypothetical protein
MGFWDNFSGCLSSSGLPTPSEVFDSAGEVLEWLEQLHSAWENAGGDEEMLLSGLVAAGAVTGIDEGVVATAAAVTVSAYLAACAGCLVGAAGQSIWDALSAVAAPIDLTNLVTAAAERQGLQPPAGALPDPSSGDQGSSGDSGTEVASADSGQGTSTGDSETGADTTPESGSVATETDGVPEQRSDDSTTAPLASA